MPNPKIIDEMEMDFHKGNTLMDAANFYPKVRDVLLEQIQNGIDSNAENIFITIDQLKRIMKFSDDGDGVSLEKFGKALKSINMTIKARGKLGQFGKGLISPIGKCEEFTFTSAAKGSQDFHCWTFNTSQLMNTTDGIKIPYQKESALLFSRNPFKVDRTKTVVNWRTQVYMKKYTRDHTISNLNLAKLEEDILERFGIAMQKAKTVIHITIRVGKDEERKIIRATSFHGAKIPVSELETKAGGKTQFNMFIAPKKARGRQGKVLIGIRHNDFRIPFSIFARSHADLFSPDMIEALTSGVLEGEIITEKCKLHPDRRSFYENDALVDFISHIETWVANTGLVEISKVNDLSINNRYQTLGRQALLNIEMILRNDKNQALLKVLSQAKKGTVGTHHYDDTKTRVKQQEEKSLTSHFADPSTNRGNGENEKRMQNPEPNTDHPNHMPFTVTGPTGRNRTVVKGHSTGLQLSYDHMPESSHLWDFDPLICRLTFNVRHPLWVDAEKNNYVLVRIQELIAIDVLTLHTLPEEYHESVKLFLEENSWAHLDWLQQISPKKGRKKIA
ncbi:MAG: ATP-binding protein [Candidatus Komeilibacteria bacterium]|nr:ATP-binding protein [Candidatus Komeilibacteria bacterium]